jgi:hypothetical protein
VVQHREFGNCDRLHERRDTLDARRVQCGNRAGAEGTADFDLDNLMTIDEVLQEVGNLHLQVKERDKQIIDLQRALSNKEAEVTKLLTQLQEATTQS